MRETRANECRRSFQDQLSYHCVLPKLRGKLAERDEFLWQARIDRSFAATFPQLAILDSF